MLIRLRYAVWLFLLFFVTTIWADVAVPTLSHRVTDLTTTLNAEQNKALENKLAAFEAKKGSQIAVLILPTTQPETIEAFSIRVFDTWKIGRKGVDDGVILIIAKDDRKLRLEVGRGLEGAIPDAIAKRILAETIKPYFKNNDYAGGIDAGVNQVISLIEGEKLPEISEESSGSTWGFFAVMAFFLAVFVGVFVAIFKAISAAFSNANKGKSAKFKHSRYKPKQEDNSSFWSSSSSSSSSSNNSSWSSSSDSNSSSDWSGGGGDSGGGGASDSW